MSVNASGSSSKHNIFHSKYISTDILDSASDDAGLASKTTLFLLMHSVFLDVIDFCINCESAYTISS